MTKTKDNSEQASTTSKNTSKSVPDTMQQQHDSFGTLTYTDRVVPLTTAALKLSDRDFLFLTNNVERLSKKTGMNHTQALDVISALGRFLNERHK